MHGYVKSKKPAARSQARGPNDGAESWRFLTDVSTAPVIESPVHEEAPPPVDGPSLVHPCIYNTVAPVLPRVPRERAHPSNGLPFSFSFC